jgi:GNAT superfamily N-acetyltransferase
VTVRRARPDDVVEIVAMVRELADYEHALDQVASTAEDFRAALFDDDPKLFAHVVEHEGTVGGFALWFVNFSTWTGRHGIYLEDLYVRPALRGLGYGKALLGELAAVCVERGYTRLDWAVLDWNEPAKAFYRSLGAQWMDEWTGNRLAGEPLAALAERRRRSG